MKKALIPISFIIFVSACKKDNTFSPDYNSPSIPAPQITNFAFQGVTLQFTDQTFVYWSGDTLNIQTNNGQNRVIMWFIIDSLRDTTYTFDPLHASIGLYNTQGAQVSYSYSMITANFSFQPNTASSGSVQGSMESFDTSPGIGNVCVSFSNLGIPANNN